MTMQTFGLTIGRINKYKGEILKHAVPMEVLGKMGRQVRFPKNQSDTYVARDRKSTRLNSSHLRLSRMPSSA